uniref:NADH dehydrogenase subunit 6 n=1 Tax=Pheidole smythiesii TaxID=297326 RepID=UPI0025807186|nr:NADH dehydrogenase subunit 6 [Pheidole smythiesii]WGV34066.1 NADH dehydrogenase subunit 6 [Pheidole smythiesii]
MIKFNYLNFFLITIILSILYMLMTNYMHPIFILILIVIYSKIICFLMSTWSLNFIYSIMLFLIMISGMMIMFLYFTSLISNNQTKFIINIPLMSSFFINIIIIFFMMKYFNYPNYEYNESLMSFLLNTNLFNNIIHIYSYPYSNITMISILYLLLTLFTIIKICSVKSTTLRKLT